MLERACRVAQRWDHSDHIDVFLTNIKPALWNQLNDKSTVCSSGKFHDAIFMCISAHEVGQFHLSYNLPYQLRGISEVDKLKPHVQPQLEIAYVKEAFERW